MKRLLSQPGTATGATIKKFQTELGILVLDVLGELTDLDGSELAEAIEKICDGCATIVANHLLQYYEQGRANATRDAFTVEFVRAYFLTILDELAPDLSKLPVPSTDQIRMKLMEQGVAAEPAQVWEAARKLHFPLSDDPAGNP